MEHCLPILFVFVYDIDVYYKNSDPLNPTFGAKEGGDIKYSGATASVGL